MTVRAIHGTCDSCGSRGRIHLVVRRKGKEEFSEFFCAECLEKSGLRPDSPGILPGPVLHG